MKCIYYKIIKRKTNEIANACWGWFDNVEKFIKEKSGDVFKYVLITKKEYDILREELLKKNEEKYKNMY
ncbi:MAG: hypothetical protein J6A98_00620 [Clostridia bacterium]|nr:hypothetical protein [Clostridia bacterium]